MKRRTGDNIVIVFRGQMQKGAILKRAFYERPPQEVAPDLLGCVLEHGACAGRIVECEAYLGENDLAAHSSRGLTRRTSVIFGPPGHAYVYFIYGMHECLNLICDREGVAGCVLIRALEPLAGVEQMRERRKKHDVRELASGPGKLTQAMGITRALNGVPVTSGALVVRRAAHTPFEICVTPRIGITQCVDLPLRFLIAGNRFVSAG